MFFLIVCVVFGFLSYLGMSKFTTVLGVFVLGALDYVLYCLLYLSYLSYLGMSIFIVNPRVRMGSPFLRVFLVCLLGRLGWVG